jgi:imidazolonepropionase-like amidohydrolase
MMFRIVRFGAWMGALVAPSGGAMAEPLAIVGAKIYPAPDAASIDDGVVVVEDGKIAAVGKRAKFFVPKTAHVIDAHGAVLTAGFWNSHVHIMPAEFLNVTWWIKERALSLAEIRAAVDMLPDSSQRETAGENMVLVELVTASERTRK